MGLLLSVLITCVGVLEVVAFYAHFTTGITYNQYCNDLTDIARNYAWELRRNHLHHLFPDGEPEEEFSKRLEAHRSLLASRNTSLITERTDEKGMRIDDNSDEEDSTYDQISEIDNDVLKRIENDDKYQLKTDIISKNETNDTTNISESVETVEKLTEVAYPKKSESEIIENLLMETEIPLETNIYTQILQNNDLPEKVVQQNNVAFNEFDVINPSAELLKSKGALLDDNTTAELANNNIEMPCDINEALCDITQNVNIDIFNNEPITKDQAYLIKTENTCESDSLLKLSNLSELINKETVIGNVPDPTQMQAESVTDVAQETQNIYHLSDEVSHEISEKEKIPDITQMQIGRGLESITDLEKETQKMELPDAEPDSSLNLNDLPEVIKEIVTENVPDIIQMQTGRSLESMTDLEKETQKIELPDAEPDTSLLLNDIPEVVKEIVIEEVLDITQMETEPSLESMIDVREEAQEMDDLEASLREMPELIPFIHSESEFTERVHEQIRSLSPLPENIISESVSHTVIPESLKAQPENCPSVILGAEAEVTDETADHECEELTKNSSTLGVDDSQAVPRVPSPYPMSIFGITTDNGISDLVINEDFLRSLDGVKPTRCDDRRRSFRKKRNSSSSSRASRDRSVTSIEDTEPKHDLDLMSIEKEALDAVSETKINGDNNENSKEENKLLDLVHDDVPKDSFSVENLDISKSKTINDSEICETTKSIENGIPKYDIFSEKIIMPDVQPQLISEEKTQTDKISEAISENCTEELINGVENISQHILKKPSADLVESIRKLSIESDINRLNQKHFDITLLNVTGDAMSFAEKILILNSVTCPSGSEIAAKITDSSHVTSENEPVMELMPESITSNSVVDKSVLETEAAKHLQETSKITEVNGSTPEKITEKIASENHIASKQILETEDTQQQENHVHESLQKQTTNECEIGDANESLLNSVEKKDSIATEEINRKSTIAKERKDDEKDSAENKDVKPLEDKIPAKKLYAEVLQCSTPKEISKTITTEIEPTKLVKQDMTPEDTSEGSNIIENKIDEATTDETLKLAPVHSQEAYNIPNESTSDKIEKELTAVTESKSEMSKTFQNADIIRNESGEKDVPMVESKVEVKVAPQLEAKDKTIKKEEIETSKEKVVENVSKENKHISQKEASIETKSKEPEKEAGGPSTSETKDQAISKAKMETSKEKVIETSIKEAGKEVSEPSTPESDHHKEGAIPKQDTSTKKISKKRKKLKKASVNSFEEASSSQNEDQNRVELDKANESGTRTTISLPSSEAFWVNE